MQNALDGIRYLYKSPQGFLGWDTFAALLTWWGWFGAPMPKHRHDSRLSVGEKQMTTRWFDVAYAHSYSIMKLQAPVYYASKEIVDAMRNTPIDSGLPVPPAVFPTACIMLPAWHFEASAMPGLDPVKHRTYVQCITYCDIRLAPSLLGMPELSEKAFSGEHAFLSMTFWVATNDGEVLAPISMVMFAENDTITVHSKKWTNQDNVLGCLGLGLYLGLAYRQVEVTEDPPVLSKAMGFGQPRGPQPLPCRWIGKNFRIARESSPDRGGTHASPQAHWRRGHWHRVRHGQGKQEVKLNWYQPVFVTGAA